MKISDKFRRRNYWMVVKVKVEDFKLPIVVPIPLFLLEDIVASMIYLYRIGGRWIPQVKEHLEKIQFGSYTVNIEDFLDFPVEVIRELRSLGRFTMVEVYDEAAQVSVKFY